eukprot:1739738-Rhodomonas_salina.1
MAVLPPQVATRSPYLEAHLCPCRPTPFSLQNSRPVTERMCLGLQKPVCKTRIFSPFSLGYAMCK